MNAIVISGLMSTSKKSVTIFESEAINLPAVTGIAVIAVLLVAAYVLRRLFFKGRQLGRIDESNAVIDLPNAQSHYSPSHMTSRRRSHLARLKP